MFTGIVEELGTVAAVEPRDDGARLVVDGTLVTSDAQHGDSISVNGVCLTVVDVGDGRFGSTWWARRCAGRRSAGSLPGTG